MSTTVIESAEGWLVHDTSLPTGKNPDAIDGAEPGHRPHWWIFPELPTTIRWESTTTKWSGPYRLNKSALNEADPDRFPLEMDEDEWYERDDIAGLYERDSETVAETHELATAEAVTIRNLDRGLPDADLSRRWVPNLVESVRHAKELHPWLPGRLNGFRAAVATALEQNPNVTDVYCSRPSRSYEPSEGPYANVRVWWSPPKTTLVKPTPRSRKKVRKETFLTIKVPLDEVPKSIRGSDVWDAAERWETQMAWWLDKFDHVGVKACGHCNGEGWVQHTTEPEDGDVTDG